MGRPPGAAHLRRYPGRRSVFLSGVGFQNRLVVALKNEKGVLETFVLAAYMFFALTLLAFLLGMGFGMWKQGAMKYGWFAEAMDFAARAANITGDIEEVRLNEAQARQYFVAAMNAMVPEYRLDQFNAVRRGDVVPGGRAEAPGYVAKVTVPVYEGKVPWLGTQRVEVPMRYFAVVTSNYQ